MLQLFPLFFVLVPIDSLSKYQCGEDEMPEFGIFATYPAPDASCIFNGSLFWTSETLEHWPSDCNIVCANISLNSESKLTEEKLKGAFSKLEVLFGDITIESTNLKSLNFLSSLRRLFYGVNIFNNSKLTNVDVFNNFSTFPTNVMMNPKLNFSKFCDRGEDLNVYGNLKDCGCKRVHIDSKSLPFYPNCTTITGNNDDGLKISEVNNSLDMTSFHELKTLNGQLGVFGTELEDLSFLKNVETIFPDFGYAFFHIENNPNLKRLGLESLKNFGPDPDMLSAVFMANHPDLCLTTNELQVFADSKILFLNCEVKICMDLYRKDGQKVCYFENLADMDSDCQHIIGDILIDASNENYVGKLEQVTNIYGSITIQNTEYLEDLGFLFNFKQVANLKMDGVPTREPGAIVNFNLTSMIRIISNKELKKVWLPNMKNPPYPQAYTNHHRIVEIRGNSLEIFRDQRECKLFQQLTQSMVKYNQRSCSKLEPRATTVSTIETTVVPKSGTTNNGELNENPTTAATKTESTTKHAKFWKLDYLLFGAFLLL